MNSVILIGRLTKDGEYHETNSGMQIYRMQIAVDRMVKQGEEKKADFPRIVVFGKQAENCNKFLGKGKQVAVQGRIQTGSYQDKDGKTIYTTDVIADRVQFLSPKEQGENPQQIFAELNENVPF